MALRRASFWRCAFLQHSFLGDGICKKCMIFCKNVYATAVLLGAICYFYLSIFVNEIVAISVASVVIVAIRILAATFHWDLPKIERPTQQ